MVVGDHQLHARKSPPLQRAEELLVVASLSVSAYRMPTISLKPSSLTAETMRTPWLTIRCPTLTFS